MGIIDELKQKTATGSESLKKTAKVMREKVNAANAATTMSAIRAMNEIWGRQTLLELMSGHVVLPDTVVNSFLNKESSRFKKINIATAGGQRIDIDALTIQGESVQLATKVISLVHNSMQSRLVLMIEKKSLPERRLLSWLLQYVSVGFLAKFFPSLDGDGMIVTIDGNQVTIDFHEKLHSLVQSRSGAIGEKVFEHMEILSIITGPGESVVNVNLHLEAGLRQALDFWKKDK